MAPLEGITVVSIEHAIAAPFATRQLADLGARVIKVERPEGGDFARDYDARVSGVSANFVWCNRSKQSITLDLKSQFGQEAILRLLGTADVFVQNLAPGASARLGLDFKTLQGLFPKLIVCDVSGYGQDGPYRDRKAYDLLIQGESGFLSITGTPDDPAKAGCAIADIAAGMYAYSNILVALYERERTGLGRHIDISMLESMAEWMSFPMYYSFDGASQPERIGASHATIYPYGPFRTADGTVMLGVQNEREWVAFCGGVIGDPQLGRDIRFDSNAKRTSNRWHLKDLIEKVFSQLSTKAVLTRLQDAKIASGTANSMADLWEHPQLAARKRWTNVLTPGGVVPALMPPGQTSAVMGAVPELGADTRRILSEIGLGDATARASSAP